MAKVTLTDAEIDALRVTHGEVVALETRGGTVVFRPPTVAEYSKFIRETMLAKPDADPLRDFELACLVAPDAATFGQWCGKWVGISKACDGPINRIAGWEENADASEDADGEWISVRTCLGVATFKLPDELQWETYRKKLEEKDKVAAALYITQCVVTEPTREVWTAWNEKKPALSLTCMPAINRLCGHEAEERGK